MNSPQCPICKTEETKWRNVDNFRMKPSGMAMCETCGFVSYPEKIANKDELLKFYESDYRSMPTVSNIHTGERKLHYHAAFLEDVFNGWKLKELKNPVVTDVGSALGIFLHWVRRNFNDAEVEGVELTKTFVRNAWHLYHIKSKPEFDTSKKYDLISSYKSLEHMVDPDVELKKYIDCLSDDGVLYFGIPIWWESLKNFGMSGWDMEYYYSPNHVNVWHRRHVEKLIAEAGGEIIKTNTTYYDTVYLIKRGKVNEEALKPESYQLPTLIESYLKTIQEVNERYQLSDFKGALELWPNFPNCWANYYEMNRKHFDQLGFEAIYREVCEKMIEACNEEADIHILAADICMRYDEFRRAMEHLEIADKLRPMSQPVFSMLANCYRMLAKHSKNEEQRVKFQKQARQLAFHMKELGAQYQNEALNYMLSDGARIPTPWETKAKAEEHNEEKRA